MNKIVFTGTHSTGKTTLLKEFVGKNYNIITEVVRELAKTGIKINKDGDYLGQTIIFNKYLEKLLCADNFISDRCLVDVLAYTKYLVDAGKVDKELYDNQLKSFIMFNETCPDVMYCYFPIEFDMVEDGVRVQDDNFRKEIDKNIMYILNSTGTKYVTIKGTHEERVEKLNSILNM